MCIPIYRLKYYNFKKQNQIFIFFTYSECLKFYKIYSYLEKQSGGQFCILLYFRVTVYAYIACTPKQNRPIETCDGFWDGHANFRTQTGNFESFDRWQCIPYTW